MIKDEGYDKVYCYPQSNVLKNKFGFKDNHDLQEADRSISIYRWQDLLCKPVKGCLDYQHLKDIHKALFQDIYDWAGKERTVDIAKSNLFCRSMFLNDMANDIFSKYAEEHYLLGTSKETAVERLAHFMGEINALHPFREGNGRSQREFIRCAAAVAGYQLSWKDVSPKEMLEASIESFDCNYEKMEVILKNGMTRMSYKDHFESIKKICVIKGELGKYCNQYFDMALRTEKTGEGDAAQKVCKMFADKPVNVPIQER